MVRISNPVFVHLSFNGVDEVSDKSGEGHVGLLPNFTTLTLPHLNPFVGAVVQFGWDL